jgi:amino acid transporter
MSTTGWGHGSVVYLSKASDGTLRDQSDPASASKARAGGAAEVGVHPGLGQLLSTSIAGNDLLSSCLYTGGICAAYAGKLAPLSLLLVSVMLYFFRFVYGEVVTAMPMNGGSYTALNNTTSKRIASLAACLSMLSYVATAVVSAESAVQYLQLVAPSVPTLSGTVVVLGIFALLNLLGISESAGVATVMFVIHVITLCVLCVWSLVWAMDNKWAVFKDNLGTPYPDTSSGSFGLALYFGYAAALLGITGFETAANYVEEMKDCQTYIFTLRNMWISVSLFNPILGALSMAVMPLSCAQVPGCTPDNQGSDSFNFIYKYQANLLGPVAGVVGGKTFKTIVCIDGVIVLAGSVLTAYVGIVGLVRRMSLDRCLPAFLLQKNSLRGTQHWIILGFFACVGGSRGLLPRSAFVFPPTLPLSIYATHHTTFFFFNSAACAPPCCSCSRAMWTCSAACTTLPFSAL